MQQECQHVFSAGCVFLTGVSRGGKLVFSSSDSVSCLPLWRSDRAKKTALKGWRGGRGWGGGGGAARRGGGRKSSLGG